MKIVWKKSKDEKGKKRSRSQPIPLNPNLPFETEREESRGDDEKITEISQETLASDPQGRDEKQLAEFFESQGNELAEIGMYNDALRKWEAAITLMPEKAILHEQKAQVLLEIGDTWNALRAAIRATEVEPSWAEAWITLGRAQLNFGEPDLAIESFDEALAIKPNYEEALIDKQTASLLVKKRKQLHIIDSSIANSRYKVGDKTECSNAQIQKMEYDNQSEQ